MTPINKGVCYIRVSYETNKKTKIFLMGLRWDTHRELKKQETLPYDCLSDLFMTHNTGNVQIDLFQNDKTTIIKKAMINNIYR